MTRYTDIELRDYLAAFAPLEAYYLTCLNGVGSESVCYTDARGKSNLLLEERNDVHSAAIDFLRRAGVPIFDDVVRLKAYEASTKRAI